MTWRWLTMQCEVVVKSQNAAKASVFYVSINVFNIKKYNRKIRSEWSLSQIHLRTCSIQVKITISLVFHGVVGGKQAGHLVLNHPLRFPSLSNFRQSREWLGSHLGTTENISRVNPGYASRCEENLGPGGGLSPRWQPPLESNGEPTPELCQNQLQLLKRWWVPRP